MSDLKNKRIINVAPTGSWPTKENNPNVPLHPEEIAEEIYNCWKAGAATAHIHCRDDDGKPAMIAEKFVEVFRILREERKDCDIILNTTTSGGMGLTEDDRLRPCFTVRPELASFDAGTMNWQHKTVFNNNPMFLERLATMLNEINVKPEIEIFDVGMLYNAQYYIKNGFLKTPAYFQFCMGAPGGMTATTKNLVILKDVMDEIAPGSPWSAFGIGKGAMEIMYAAIAMGGHIRVGMEDNVLYRKGELATSNMQFVERAKRAIEEFGCEVATPDEARQILNLK